MSVGVQREPCGEMSQHTGQSLDVHTVLQGDGSEGVSEVVESDLGDASPFEDSFQHVVDTVQRDGAAVGGREHILVAKCNTIVDDKL